MRTISERFERAKQTNEDSRGRPRDEILERVRRMETRITELCHFLGLSTKSAKPTWSAEQGSVIIPTDACSLRDILAAVPDGILRGPDNEVEIWHKGRFVASLYGSTQG